MRSKFAIVSTFVAVLAMLIHSTPAAEGRGGGRGGGGGGRGGSGGGGSFSRSSSGGSSRANFSGSRSSASRPSSYSRPSMGSVSRQSTGSVSRPSGGRVSASPATRPPAGGRPSFENSASQLPSGMRPGTANRPSQLPSRAGGIASDRPGGGAAGRPGAGNFLGVAGGAAAGSALANRPGLLPSTRPGAGDRRPAERPQDRANWSERSQNRNAPWQQRVNNRGESWNKWQNNSQQRRDNFQQNREGRWDNLQAGREDRQNWRDQNREDWQQHRNDMWDYRYDRADEVWHNARDFYDDRFDDRWWGGFGYVGYHPVNPWWWWVPVTWAAANSFIYATAPPPVYVDYGTTVVYEGETVYVDNQPVPAEKYNEPIVNLATNVGQPPPPVPPAEGQPAEWMPLGVFALAQEKKGDPVMFFQISVNREGLISGGYESVLTGDKKTIAGQVDKATQNVAWRVGENTKTIFTTTLANLTLDVSTVAIHFDDGRVQTWLLVRMPPPPAADQPPKAPEINRKPPPVTPIPLPAR